SHRVFSQQLLQIDHFSGELLRDGLFYPLTGAAASGVIECALHMKTFRKTRAAIIHIIAGGRTVGWRQEQRAGTAPAYPGVFASSASEKSRVGSRREY